MSNYVFGFSVPAFVVLVLFLVPRIWWRLSPPRRDLLVRNYARRQWVNYLRNGCLVATCLLLLFLVDREHGNGFRLNSALVLLILVLVLHYAAWILYQRGRLTPFLLIFGIALLSSLYLLAAGTLLYNSVAMIPALLYGILYVAVTWNNVRPK